MMKSSEGTAEENERVWRETDERKLISPFTRESRKIQYEMSGAIPCDPPWTSIFGKFQAG
jgi:hypothetical protein